MILWNFSIDAQKPLDWRMKYDHTSLSFAHINDIEKAVQQVSDRDYPELNQAEFDPIYIPKLFIAKYAEAVDQDLFIEDLIIGVRLVASWMAG